MSDAQQFKAKSNTKAMIMYVEEINNRRILIVAIRGTVTRNDWMLNINNASKKTSKVGLDIPCPAGLLLMTIDTPCRRSLARGVPHDCRSNGEANCQRHLGDQAEAERDRRRLVHGSIYRRCHCAASLCHVCDKKNKAFRCSIR